MPEPLPNAYVLGTWRDPQAFLSTCAAARDAGFPGITAFAPFPVHGLETAMGHKPSWIGRAALAAIVVGGIACHQFFIQSSYIEWPINVSGMPYNSPAFWTVEIMEAALLAGALVNLGACFHACKLVPGDTTVVDPRATDDSFCLVVPVCGERYSADSITRWMENHHAERIESRGAAPAPAQPAEAAHA